MQIDEIDQRQEEISVPDDLQLFHTKQTSFKHLHIPKSYLTYNNNETTIQQLSQQFIRKHKINNQQISVYFIIDKVTGTLSPNLTIQQLKLVLLNNNLQDLVLEPLLKQSGSIVNEGSTCQYFQTSPLYMKDLFYSQNSYDIGLYFPQFNMRLEQKLNCDFTIQKQVRRIVKQKGSQIYSKGKQLYKEDKLIVKLKESGQSIDTSLLVKNELKHKRVLSVQFPDVSAQCVHQDHEKITITFQVLKGEKPHQKTQLLGNISQILLKEARIQSGIDSAKTDQQFMIKETIQHQGKTLQFTYYSIKYDKIQQILARCEIRNPTRHGIQILGKLLKPFQALRDISSLIQKVIQGNIDAYIVPQGQFFYILSQEYKHEQFKISQIQQIKGDKIQKIKDKVRQRRQINSNSITNKQKQFYQMIVSYTSTFFYQGLNKFMRNRNFFFYNFELIREWECKFSFKLIQCLMRVCNYNGITFRGCNFVDQRKLGQVFCFKSFTSSSTDPSKAKKFCSFGTYGTFYIIMCFTGKNISKYSFYNQEEVLFLPFTYFEVIEIYANADFRIITLLEIPMPRRSKNNLLFWVDDSPKQSSVTYEQLFNEVPSLSTEFIQLISNKHLLKWLQIFAFKIQNRDEKKMALITDMWRSKEEPIAGVQTIKIMRKHIPDIDVFVYISDITKNQKILTQHNILIDNRLNLLNQRKRVKQQIKERVLNKQQFQENKQCQLI